MQDHNDDYEFVGGKWILKDGRRARFNATVAMDGFADDGVAFDGHRPGFRAADRSVQEAADRSHAERVRAVEGAWRTPQRVENDTEDAAEVGRVLAAGDVQKIRDAAWTDYCTRISEMWRNA